MTNTADFEALFDALPDAVFAFDDDRVRACNDAAEALSTTPDPVGTGLCDCLPAELVDGLDAATRTAIAAGASVDASVDAPEGGYRVRVVPREDGSIAVVEERDGGRAAVPDVDEGLEAFASVVSHDLRNPLDVARWRTEAAIEEIEAATGGESGGGARPDAASGDGGTDLDPEALLTHLGKVQGAHERIDDLLSDVLAMARHGADSDEVAPVSLAATAESAWETVETGDATLAVEDDLTLLAGESRLAELFENVFRNAVEHGAPDADGGSGDPSLTVRVGPLLEDGDPVGFYVADDGTGIPAEDRECVFEMGYSTDDDGTGFGLAIVAAIADGHGWSVNVGESEGGGARFSVRGVEVC